MIIIAINNDRAGAAVDTLGILAGNLDCWDRVPGEALAAVVGSLVKGVNSKVRSKLAKLLRLALADAHAGPLVREALQGESLGLDERQQAMVLAEIFDTRTLAGQAAAEALAERAREAERAPADELPPEARKVIYIYIYIYINRTNSHIVRSSARWRWPRPSSRPTSGAGTSRASWSWAAPRGSWHS